MWRWLEVWLEYLQELWGHGCIALLTAVVAGFQGFLFIGLPAFLTAELIADGDAWEAIDGWFYLSAIVWFPIFLGNAKQHFRGLEPPKMPPGIRDRHLIPKRTSGSDLQ